MKIKKEDTENENLKSKKRNAEKDVNKTLRHHCNELSDKEIESQANQIIEFLQLVHPHTIESAYGDAIEIRPVQRDADEFEYVRSYSTFTLTGERDKEELIKFLKRVNGKGFCVYYSLFAFDYNLDVFKDNGKLFGKGRVNKTNATYTTTLMADFDKVSIEDYESKYKPLFEKIGLETYDIFSGNGVQSLILLDKRCYDKNILNKFTRLLTQKGFNIDTAITDSARVARLPYTYNCKELDENQTIYNPIDAEIPRALPIIKTAKRYSIVEVFEKLNQLDDVIVPVSQQEVEDTSVESIEEVERENTKPLLQSEITEAKVKAKREVETCIKDSKEAYKEVLDLEILPPTIQKVLSKPARTGIRNSVLLFIVPFFKNELGFNVYEAQAILRVWGSRCEEPLGADYIDNEVKRLWVYNIKHKQGYYNQELVDEYGYLEMTIVKDRSYIAIPQHLIDSLSLKAINPGTLKFYLLMLVDFHKNKNKSSYNVTQDEIAKICGVSKPTACRHLRTLVNNGLVMERIGSKNRKEGDATIYYPSPLARAKGGRKISVSVVKNIYSSDSGLNDGEAMMMFYLKVVLCYHPVVITSQSKIGEALAKTQPNVNQLTSSLHEKGFIYKETLGSGFWKKTTYEVLE